MTMTLHQEIIIAIMWQINKAQERRKITRNLTLTTNLGVTVTATIIMETKPLLSIIKVITITNPRLHLLQCNIKWDHNISIMISFMIISINTIPSSSSYSSSSFHTIQSPKFYQELHTIYNSSNHNNSPIMLI